jgi:L-asparaginase II
VGQPPAVLLIRSGVVESIHLVHVAVCDAEGRLVSWAGDPDRRVFARSCMKPLQAAVSLASSGGERLTERQVAVICASHNGEPVHVRSVRSVLARAGLSEADLATPFGLPLDPEERRRVRNRRRVFHDCSGKHAGMLMASVRSGWPVATYRGRGHPLQRRILRAVRAGSSAPDVRVGVDGCGVPVHGMPLRAMATLYARLAEPERLGQPLAEHAARAASAMRRHPYLVGGRHRLDTAVMTHVTGVIAKEGAEALACAAVLEAGLGIAVRVHDGGYRAVGPTLVGTLDQLGILDRAGRAALRPYARPPVLGGGDRVGNIEASFSLEKGR